MAARGCWCAGLMEFCWWWWWWWSYRRWTFDVMLSFPLHAICNFWKLMTGQRWWMAMRCKELYFFFITLPCRAYFLSFIVCSRTCPRTHTILFCIKIFRFRVCFHDNIDGFPQCIKIYCLYSPHEWPWCISTLQSSKHFNNKILFYFYFDLT